MKTACRIVLLWWCLLVLPATALAEQTVVREIYFALDRAEIRAEALPVLREVADLLRANPGLRVHIAGYTCDLAPDAYNLELAQRHATATLNHLVQVEGITRDRVIERAFGEAQPAYPNTDEASRAKNRRVVLTLAIPEPPPAPVAVAPPAPVTPPPHPAPAVITRTVQASVTDASGNFIPDLRPTQFTVREAGQVREIVSATYTMEQLRSSGGLLLDVSHSNCLIDLRDSVREFLAGTNPATRWYVGQFNTALAQPAGGDPDRAALLEALPQLQRAGGTHLYDAVAEAAQAMSRRSATRYLLVFSDGIDEAGWSWAGATASTRTVAQAVAAARAAGVKLLTVELGPTTAAATAALRELAQGSGGLYLAWDQAAGPAQFAPLHRLLNAGGSRGMYTITYRTTEDMPRGATVTSTAGTVQQ